jgi:DNA polymerase-3 subunit gamma/tau
VLSRCLQFSLKRLSAQLIGERLKFIAAAENLEFEPAAMALLARAAEGSMRDGLSLMDQLIAFAGGSLNETDTRTMLGTIDRGHVTRILDALARQDGPDLLAQVQELDRDAPDYDRALTELAAFLQRIAIVQIVPEAAAQDEEFDGEALTRLARTLSPEDVQLYYQIALGGRRDMAMAPEPRIGFEMSLLRMLAFRPETARSSAAPSAPGAGRPPAAPSAAPPVAPFAAPAARSAHIPATIDAGNWAAVVEAASLSGMVRQIALNCVPASFDGSLLRLSFDESAAHQRSRQMDDKLAQSLSAYLGRDIRIAFESAADALVTPARRRAMAEQDKSSRASAAFEEDPAVKNLRQRFGAEVDPASVKPAN